MTDRYAVFGNPISHSKSPLIHSVFARDTAQNISYTAQLVDLNGFERAASDFFSAGGKGFNITVPFKEQAYLYADRLSPQAELAGAVNTLLLDQGSVVGHNTDGVGLVSDLKINCGVSLKGKKVLVLGAGGAVRGCIQPILDERPASVHIANRTFSKAQGLAELFNGDISVKAVEYSQLNDSFDLIINGTSASLNSEMPPLTAVLLHPSTFCYDMMYGAGITKFNSWASDNGCNHVSDGLGMLVSQAAEAFYLWRGVRPLTKNIILDIRSSL